MHIYAVTEIVNNSRKSSFCWKRRTVKVRAGLLGCVSLAIIGCSSGSPESLVGEYALRANGVAEVRVTKYGNKYTASVRRGGGWSNAEEVLPCGDKHYARLFGPDWKSIQPVGLCARSGPFAIFKVKKGSRFRRRTLRPTGIGCSCCQSTGCVSRYSPRWAKQGARCRPHRSPTL